MLAIHSDHGYLFPHEAKNWENKQMPASSTRESS